MWRRRGSPVGGLSYRRICPGSSELPEEVARPRHLSLARACTLHYGYKILPRPNSSDDIDLHGTITNALHGTPPLIAHLSVCCPLLNGLPPANPGDIHNIAIIQLTRPTQPTCLRQNTGSDYKYDEHGLGDHLPSCIVVLTNDAPSVATPHPFHSRAVLNSLKNRTAAEYGRPNP